MYSSHRQKDNDKPEVVSTFSFSLYTTLACSLSLPFKSFVTLALLDNEVVDAQKANDIGKFSRVLDETRA